MAHETNTMFQLILYFINLSAVILTYKHSFTPLGVSCLPYALG
jgi:hypothetical protein